MITKVPTNTIVDVPGILVGHAENDTALTGCTVIRMEFPAICGVDVRGSAPGTRETDLLNPLNLVQTVNAICLSGGSAYGLDAASGVMKFLEEQGVGLNVGVGLVPIVPAAVLFDLAVGDPKVRPDSEMGYLAASRASKDAVKQGNAGAGMGASVGKLNGFENAMKSGLGSASRTLSNGLVIGAIVAVNAVGEVRYPQTGEVLAGARNQRGKIGNSLSFLEQHTFSLIPPGTNTTIAAIACNANLTKSEATKVAQMAHDGLARTIYPVHTMHDGDTIFTAATGGINAPVDLVGSHAAEVLAEAVVQAVMLAESAGGLPAFQDFKK